MSVNICGDVPIFCKAQSAETDLRLCFQSSPREFQQEVCKTSKNMTKASVARGMVFLCLSSGVEYRLHTRPNRQQIKPQILSPLSLPEVQVLLARADQTHVLPPLPKQLDNVCNITICSLFNFSTIIDC